MLLQGLLNGIQCSVYGDDSVNVTSLCCNSSSAKAGSLFFCLKGNNFDGHDFVGDVLRQGAVAVVCERKLNVHATQIVVADTRQAMAFVAKNFYGNVADEMQIITVVGTNGKTSTSYILQSILSKAGRSVGVIGTNGIFYCGTKQANLLTTPDPVNLHYWLRQMFLAKVNTVIIEVSAHAVALRKTCGIVADVGIFTNFSQDHLDFFGNMQHYADVKASYFADSNVRQAVVNADDALGRRILATFPHCTAYSAAGKADCFATDVSTGRQGSRYKLNAFGQVYPVFTPLCGTFNVYNTLAAATCALLLGVDADDVTQGIANLHFIEGRNQTFWHNGVRTVVDYAHTPDGIDNVLSYLAADTHGKLVVVFGCGGNRDKSKRAVMGQCVSAYAHFAVVTNDNPRYEDALSIALQVSRGVTVPHKILLNRRLATHFALSLAGEGDTVAILGKGAEEYQEVNGVRLPYSDVQTVQEYFAAHSAE